MRICPNSGLLKISIHALRVEGDIVLPCWRCGGESISIHALRVEGDREQRDRADKLFISIHALRVEGDGAERYDPQCQDVNFYPRPPRRGRLGYRKEDCDPIKISIHALRVEGDGKHAEVQACISAAYLKCSTRKAAASRRCADLGGKAVLFHQFPHLVLGRARCEPRGEGMCDRGSHRQSGRKWFKLTAIKCHPGSTEGPGRCVPPCFYSGCPADKSAGCPSEDRSAQ